MLNRIHFLFTSAKKYQKYENDLIIFSLWLATFGIYGFIRVVMTRRSASVVHELIVVISS